MDEIQNPPIYNVASGEQAQIPDEQISDAIQSGKYAFPKGVGIPVIDPETGDTRTIPSEFANQAFGQGFKFQPLAERQQDALQSKYGTIPAQIGTFISGVAKAGSLSGSDWLLTNLPPEMGGLTPDDLAKYREANPISENAGEVLGIIGSLGIGKILAPAEDILKAAKETGNIQQIAQATENLQKARGLNAIDLLNPAGAVSKIGKGIQESINGIPGHVIAGSVEGAIYGAAQTSSEAAQGDPDANAEKLMQNVGLSALIGGGIGGVFGIGAKGYNVLLGKFKNPVDEILSDVPRSSLVDPDIKTGIQPTSIVQRSSLVNPDIKTGIQPTSIEDIIQRNATAVQRGEVIALPEQAIVKDAADSIPLKHPITPLEYDSLQNQTTRDEYKIFRELPGEAGDALRNEENARREELKEIQKNSIKELSPNVNPAINDIESGQRATDAFNEILDAEKKEVAPKIAALKSQEYNEFHLPGVIDEMTSPTSKYGNPSIAEMFDTTGADIKIKPYDTGMGINKKTYSNIKDAINAMEKNPTDLPKLFNIRDNLDQGVSFVEKGKALQELGHAKAAMMEYIQNTIQKNAPEQEVRDFFRRYAVAKKAEDFIERRLGVKLGKPVEKISDKIFSDTESVKAARVILGKDKFNELLANHLSADLNNPLMTKDGRFSSAKWYTYLSKNQSAFEEAFRDRPDLLKKLKDVNTLMRLSTDITPSNPSGTANKLMKLLNTTNPISIMKNIKDYISENMEKQQKIQELNFRLSGDAEQAEKLKNADSILKKTSKKIESGVRDILDMSWSGKGFVASELAKLDDHKETTEKINELAGNPQKMMMVAQNIGHDLYPVNPKLSQSAQVLAVKTAQFLSSKVPFSSQKGPFNDEIEPSKADIMKFGRYVEAVDNPIGVLREVGSGTVSNEALETLNTIYPKLYNQMKQEIISQVSTKKPQMPYQLKLSLSRFIGEPLSPSMTPQSINASQAIHIQQMQQMTGAQGKSEEKSPKDASNRISLTPNDDV